MATEFTHYDEKALNRMCQVINDWATEKGWNDGSDSIDHKAAQIALMHSELSECLEFVRKKPRAICPSGCEAGYEKLGSNDRCSCGELLQYPPPMDDHVPSLTGEAAELADVLIRIFHYCGKRDINLGEAVVKKHAYNINRPYRHGKNL